MDFSSFENLTGGSGIDAFTVSAVHTGNLSGGLGDDSFNLTALLTGNVDGGGGSDTLSYGGNAAAVSVTRTGLGGTDGFAGTGTNISGTFDNINVATGSGNTDTL